MFNEEQIKSNWELFMNNLGHITGDRYETLYSFYDKYANRVALMPASSKESYHNCFTSGYCDHVNRVVELSFEVKELWERMGANIDFTDEELAMVAINHDLGKFGTFEEEAYLDQDEDWKLKRGELYKHNSKVPFMKIQDRSLFILQSLGVQLTENEYLGIKLHDGLFEEGNKGYYIAFSEDYKIRSNLPYIVHQADLMAARIEGDLVKNSKAGVLKKLMKQPVQLGPSTKNNPDKEAMKTKRIIPDVPKEDRTFLVEGIPTKTKKKYSV